VIAAALVGAPSRPVAASAFDVFGFGPAGVAEVNARGARADDGTATFYNPGGLGFGRGVRVEVSPTLGVSSLSAQGQPLPLEDPFGIAIALDATVPFTGALRDRFRVGFGGYFLPSAALRLIAKGEEEPVFPYYENRSQRLVLLMALAARIAEGIGIGAGVNVLGGVTGAADVRAGASSAPEPRIDVEATTRVAAHVGVRLEPAPNVRVGLTYRQRFSVPAVVVTTAEVGGIPLDVAVDVREALFDPHTFVLASSFDVGRATFEIDVSYAAWSSYAGPFVGVRAELPGVLAVSEAGPALYRDVVSARVAATYSIEVERRAELTLRGGAGVEPSMLKSAQQGRTNIADGDKAIFGLGASIAVRDVLPRTVRMGLGVGAQVVSAFEQGKRACVAQPCPPGSVVGPDGASPGEGVTNPGYPRLVAGGALWSLALGFGVDL
jgi:hypothetical protein